jgi:quinol monooxygenase YgiN
LYVQASVGGGEFMIKVVAKNYIKEEKINEVLEIIKELIEETRKEKGCIIYELFQDVQNKGVITFIEEWENMEILKKHMESEHFKRIVPKIQAYAEKEGEISLYTKLI